MCVFVEEHKNTPKLGSILSAVCMCEWLYVCQYTLAIVMYIVPTLIMAYIITIIPDCTYMYYQVRMSRPKGRRSVQLRGMAFESERSRHFPYMDLFSSGA